MIHHKACSSPISDSIAHRKLWHNGYLLAPHIKQVISRQTYNAIVLILIFCYFFLCLNLMVFFGVAFGVFDTDYHRVVVSLCLDAECSFFNGLPSSSANPCHNPNKFARVFLVKVFRVIVRNLPLRLPSPIRKFLEISSLSLFHQDCHIHLTQLD